MQNLIFDQDFDLPPVQVFEFFAEHENLEVILGAKITRVSDGTDGNRNGVGSVRRLKVGPSRPFEETVTAYEPDRRLAYRITKGSPLKDHDGELIFTPDGEGTHLNWRITFGTVVPGLDHLIALGLKRSMAKGLSQAEPSK